MPLNKETETELILIGYHIFMALSQIYFLIIHDQVMFKYIISG